MSPIQTQLVELPWGQGLETKQGLRDVLPRLAEMHPFDGAASNAELVGYRLLRSGLQKLSYLANLVLAELGEIVGFASRRSGQMDSAMTLPSRRAALALSVRHIVGPRSEKQVQVVDAFPIVALVAYVKMTRGHDAGSEHPRHAVSRDLFVRLSGDIIRSDEPIAGSRGGSPLKTSVGRRSRLCPKPALERLVRGHMRFVSYRGGSINAY